MSHGSLTKAGRVRLMTPKVPKQNKKRNPIGRAKKRDQYLRRVVNGNPKTSPNSSPFKSTKIQNHSKQ